MMKSQITPFPLRLAPDLREKLDAAAKRAGRSLQSEISARLAATFESGIEGSPDSGKDEMGDFPGTANWKRAGSLAPDPEMMAKVVVNRITEQVDDYLAKLVAQLGAYAGPDARPVAALKAETAQTAPAPRPRRAPAKRK